jgi:hypothetical protein
MSLFLDPLFYFIDLYVVLMPVTCCFCYIALQCPLKSSIVILLKLLFVLRFSAIVVLVAVVAVVVILGIFCFYINLEFFSISMKNRKCFCNFDGECQNLFISFSDTVTLILPLHEHRRYLHFLVFSLIYFFSVL